MIYEITAPIKTYNRRLYEVQFVNGKGETDNEKAAKWFAGRQGFSVSAKKEVKKNETDENKADETKKPKK